MNLATLVGALVGLSSAPATVLNYGQLTLQPSGPQSIASVSLSGSTFPAGSPSGTTIGSINVVMSPPSPAFAGTLSLSNPAKFKIVGTTLETNDVIPAGTWQDRAYYEVYITATQAGSSVSQIEVIAPTLP